MGLLLVTKLLPAGDERTVQAVYDAVGPTFLGRLLLSLSSAAVRPVNANIIMKTWHQWHACQCSSGAGNATLSTVGACDRIRDIDGTPGVPAFRGGHITLW